MFQALHLSGTWRHADILPPGRDVRLPSPQPIGAMLSLGASPPSPVPGVLARERPVPKGEGLESPRLTAQSHDERVEGRSYLQGLRQAC